MTLYIIVYMCIYMGILVYTHIYYFQARRMRAYLDSLSMDGADVAVNCLCSARSCARCWCPDSELADGHRGECHYRRMAEVMEQLDAARDDLLDEEDHVVGRVKDVKAVEGCRGQMVKTSGWRSFDHQFEPYPRAIKAAP